MENEMDTPMASPPTAEDELQNNSNTVNTNPHSNSSQNAPATAPKGPISSLPFNPDIDVLLNPTKEQIKFPGTRHFKRWLRSDGVIVQEYLATTCAKHRKYLRTRAGMEYLQYAGPQTRLFYRGGNFKGLPTKGIRPVQNLEEIALALAIFFNNKVARKKGTRCQKKGKNYEVSLKIPENELDAADPSAPTQDDTVEEQGFEDTNNNQQLDVKDDDGEEQTGADQDIDAQQHSTESFPDLTNNIASPSSTNTLPVAPGITSTTSTTNAQHLALQGAFWQLQKRASIVTQEEFAFQLQRQLTEAQATIHRQASQIVDLQQLVEVHKQIAEAQKTQMAQQQARLRELGDTTMVDPAATPPQEIIMDSKESDQEDASNNKQVQI